MKFLSMVALAVILTAFAFPVVAQDEDEVLINAGFNDNWFNPDTAGQGFGITVFPEIGEIFLTWYTYDTERPGAEVTAKVGEPGHRWLTAFGPYSGSEAVLDIELTQGGVFDSVEPMPTQGPDGTVILEFSGCNEGTVTYDITSAGLQGVIPIERITLDNVPLCEQLSVLTEDETEELTACESAANKMFLSCRYEVSEEYYASNAKCINLGDENERTACEEVAEETLVEEREGCADPREARLDLCELLGEDRFDPEALLDTDNFVVEPDGSNPYFSLEPGHTVVARAGEDYEETIVVTVTDEVREILGVNCRVAVDIVLLEDEGEYEAVEVTDDWYAQALNGDIYYCGEVARNYEDGVLRDLDGSFEAGLDLAKSGVLIRSAPVTGESHRQEYLPGEAEDAIRYVAGVGDLTSVGEGEGGENPNFPCNGNCVKTEEFIPPEPDSGEYKYYMADVGFVLGIALEDGEPSGERDEVLCVGDSLSVLETEACGIDAEALPDLLDILCELSPAGFCSE